MKTAPLACDFCGLPIDDASGGDRPRYCCYGCRFASSITAADGDEGQSRLAMTRLGLAVFFAMNVMVFTMLLWSQPGEPTDRLASLWYDVARYACLLFTLPVLLLLGGPLLADAMSELRRGRASMSVLLVVGVAASCLYSVWSLLTEQGHVYFEIACTVLVAVTLGRWFEATGKLRTTAALRGLKQLLPDKVRLLRDGDEVLADSAELQAGQQFRVLPGERIAADGEIVRHQAAIDEQAVTGESIPTVRRPGERVLSGTLVLDGPLDIRAATAVGEGVVARMIEAVARATAARSQYERLAEQLSRWFLPVVALTAATTLIVHAGIGRPAEGLFAALAVLIIACPCALGLATPMALWAAIGRAAQAGVLIRNGDALPLLASARTICFDKTGTLTTGQATVQRLRYDPRSNKQTLLRVAGALGRVSSHPLAVAVRHFADQSLLGQSAAIESAVVQAGYGICGQSDDVAATAFLGSRRWMIECGQRIENEASWQQEPSDELAAETLLAWDGCVRARFLISEAIRPEAASAIQRLKEIDCRSIMLTGDREPRAQALAAALALDYRAALLPEAKVAAIGQLQTDGPVVMVGDGINDAPALATADVGIALGSGADISRDSAAVCLLTSDLSRLPWLIQLARRTQHTIRWNLAWAFGYNVAGIGLAAAGWLHPVIAAVAMAISSVLVVTNSLSLAHFELDHRPSEARR